MSLPRYRARRFCRRALLLGCLPSTILGTASAASPWSSPGWSMGAISAGCFALAALSLCLSWAVSRRG